MLPRKLFFAALPLLALGVGLNLVSQRTNFFSQASGTEANLVVDTSVVLAPNYHWKNFAQGGEKSEPMLGNAQDLITKLDPEYIRLDHIYDFYNVVSRDSNGQLTFNWAELDVAVNQIVATGAKPFLSLSYMPKALAEKDIDQPRNWTDWELVVQRTIEHYSRDLGISNIYYEVWNEPDLFGSYKVYGEKNYLDLYWHSAIGAARAQGATAYKFGGPATTALYENWVTTLVTFAQARGLRLDFISWHRYDMDSNVFEADLMLARRWLVENFPQNSIELLITEMGHNPAVDPGYDTQFGAIHTLSSLTALDGIDKAFSFELIDGEGPQKLWGRWGIITNEKFGLETKPRYNAFTFLNSLIGGRVNVIGEGTWVKAMARGSNGIVRVLVVNYDHKGSHTETVPLNFINLSGTSYQLKRTDFTGRISQKAVSPENGSITSIEYFAPNSASIFELIPQ